MYAGLHGDAGGEMTGDGSLVRCLVAKLCSPPHLLGHLEHDERLHYFDTHGGSDDNNKDDLDMSHNRAVA